ncbi:MAG: FG-GAP-like repeat-containing protein [Myxococcota bacterium]
MLLTNNWAGAGWFSTSVFAPNAASDFNTDYAEAGDFDGDGWTDVIRMSSPSTAIDFCRNVGGTFPTCTRIFTSNQCRSEEFAIADFNNDGKQDLVVPYSTTTAVTCRTLLLLGRGNGGFTGYTSFLPPETEPTRAVAVGDVDKDGDVDILLGQDSNNPTRLYLNNWKNLDASGTCSRQIPDFTNKVYAANGKNYAMSNFTTDWSSARAFCQLYGYDLWQVDDQAEANFVRLDTTANFPRQQIWIGHYDPIPTNTVEENVGTFSGGASLLPVDRCTNEPNSQSEYCWQYDANSAGTPAYTSACTADTTCTQGNYFVCEHAPTVPACSGTWQFVNAQYGTGGQFPNVSGNVYDVQLVDIDKDNDLDAIVAVNQAAQQTKVLMNNGVGIFAADDGLRWPQNEQVRHERLHLVDVDFDGDMDVISRLSGFEVRVYINQLFTPGVPGQAPAGFSNETAVRWPSANGKDVRTDVVGLAIGDLDDDDLPDVYVVGQNKADRMVMNDGFEENLPWQNQNRVGVGKFRFNTYRALPERYYNARSSALGDFNHDGYMDIARCGYNETVSLWQNDGNGKFNDITLQAFPQPMKLNRCSINGLKAVDMNADGWTDIIVEPHWNGGSDCPAGTTGGISWTNCTFREHFINNARGAGQLPTFRNVAPTNMPYAVSNYTDSIDFVDVDHDGDLDWLWGIGGGSDARLFVNGGDVFNTGAPYGFEKTTDWLSGIGTRANITRMVQIDINGDVYPDLYVAVSGQNRVWRNEGGTRYSDVTVAYSNSISDTTRDVLVYDFNRDGTNDLMVLNNGLERYHSQEPNGKTFTDITATSLPGNSDNSYGGDVGDFDKDGFTDFYVANADDQNRMYLNLGTGRFQDLTANLPFDVHTSYDALVWDFDNDCDLDVYVMNGAGASGGEQDRIYINTLQDHCPP